MGRLPESAEAERALAEIKHLNSFLERETDQCSRITLLIEKSVQAFVKKTFQGAILPRLFRDINGSLDDQPRSSVQVESKSSARVVLRVDIRFPAGVQTSQGQPFFNSDFPDGLNPFVGTNLNQIQTRLQQILSDLFTSQQQPSMAVEILDRQVDHLSANTYRYTISIPAEELEPAELALKQHLGLVPKPTDTL